MGHEEFRFSHISVFRTVSIVILCFVAILHQCTYIDNHQGGLPIVMSVLHMTNESVGNIF